MPRIPTSVGLAVIGVCLLIFGGGAYWHTQLRGDSAGPNEGVTLSDVVEDPAAYAGQRVTISGEVQETDLLTVADAELVFPIGDDAGSGRLLVFPQEDVDLPRLGPDSVVRVRGVVQPVGQEETPAEGIVDRVSLLRDTEADAAIEATDVRIVPVEEIDEDPLDPPVRRATIDQILRDPEAWDTLRVQVPGVVEQVGPAGFVLQGDRRSIFVSAPYSDLSGLEPGDRVRIAADVWLLSQWRADTVYEALDPTPLTDAADEEPPVEPGEIPDQAGDVFLALRFFSEGGPQYAQ